MSRSITDDDVDAVAQRVVSLISERIAVVRTVREQTPVVKTMDAIEIPIKLTYTLKQLCAELNLSADTLYKLENQGRLRPLPGIRHKIYSRVEIERFLSSAETKWRPSK